MPKLSENNLLKVYSVLLTLAIATLVAFYLYSNLKGTTTSKASSQSNFVADKPILFLQSTCSHGQTKPTVTFSRPDVDLSVGIIEYTTTDSFANAKQLKFAKGESEKNLSFDEIGKNSLNLSARWRYQDPVEVEWSEVLKMRIDPCS